MKSTKLQTIISLLNISLVICLFGCAAKKTSSVPTDTKPAVAADTAKSTKGLLEFDNPYEPDPDEEVFVEERPIMLTPGRVHYPEAARKSEIEGSVWVKVLIGRDGVVKSAIVATAAEIKIGFEESALRAAKETKWRPAIQNGQPIPLWVTYEIKFQLKP